MLMVVEEEEEEGGGLEELEARLLVEATAGVETPGRQARASLSVEREGTKMSCELRRESREVVSIGVGLLLLIGRA